MAPRRAHHCSILLHKAIRGPHRPQIMGDAFPMTIDSSRPRACCMFAMMSLQKPQWETLMKCFELDHKLRREREKNNNNTVGGMLQCPLIIIIIIIQISDI